MEVRSFLPDGREVTDLLRQLDVNAVSNNVENKEAIERLMKLEAVHEVANSVTGTWTTKVAFHWQQTFPAGKRVSVRHTYKPVVGSTFLRKDTPGWCPDKRYRAAFEKLAKINEPVPGQDGYLLGLDEYLPGEWVKYVLTTGANWSSPIGRFTLFVDMVDADLVSTCPIPGLTLVRNENSFTAMATDYVPKSDLNILLVKGRCASGKPCPKN